MNSYSDVVPPGFRFHPTDEELVDYYLRKRVASKRIDLDVIKDIDLYRIEPWDLQELCQAGTEDQSDYYFFSHKDKKYPTGTRTNRATREGFWKATGRDKPIYVKRSLVGMRKTLVFYKGRAPNGLKLDWIMHEYRLETDENATPQEEGWVVCRVFKKRMVIRKDGEHQNQHESPYWCDEQTSFLPDIDSPMQIGSSSYLAYDPSSYSSCKQEQQSSHLHYTLAQDASFLDHLPQHDTRSQIPISADINSASLYSFEDQGGAPQQNYYQPHFNDQNNMMYGNNNSSSFIDDDDDDDQQQDEDGMNTGWRVLDKFVASQLSLDVTGENHNYLNH